MCVWPPSSPSGRLRAFEPSGKRRGGKTSAPLFKSDLLERRHPFVLALVVVLTRGFDLVAGFQVLGLVHGLTQQRRRVVLALVVLEGDGLRRFVDRNDLGLRLVGLASAGPRKFLAIIFPFGSMRKF